MDGQEMKDAAYVISEAIAALTEAMGMVAENQYRLGRGETIAYGEDAFNKLHERYAFGHNSVLSYYRR